MNITLRLLLGYFLIVGLAAWFVLNSFSQEVKPGVRQTMEETLVDTAHLLAEMAMQDKSSGKLDTKHFAAAFERYQAREPHADIWGFKKDSLDLRVYITDARGIVVYDSEGKVVGQDYSKWNDVYLTLHGRYGVRSTQDDPNDNRSAVMHVAAPILHQDKLIGVLTVAKPTLSVQPFIDRSRQRIERAGWWLMGGSLAIGLLFTWWLTRSIGLLRRYAREVSLGKKAQLPEMSSGELAELGRALAEMREKLDGREYVENYVHHLAHEMKSPLTALIGSAELLDENMPQAERAVFTHNIREQSQRLKDMLDKLLALAKVEHRTALEDIATIDLRQLADTVVSDLAIPLQQHRITCDNRIAPGAKVNGETFLLRQALSNLLTNAIDFSPDGGHIELTLESSDRHHTLILRDHGSGIPDYALPHIFERFYSLARPGTQRKSSGLGLPFVKQVVELHGGEVSLRNHPQGGVEARVVLAGA
ncbi:MAG: two-component system sensor histidine kinase CreC [Gammaproteobacteria bacterium]|nr:two-component system sensor histidine kinase CreC [Gammaproteobacteria bacterium]MBU1777652.1 two-component system sensor histidine kinase CreC [Gammaproteobacteria bacterium]MBU1967875.1 two-component system sensor histidine kinase CreC [Gammaproteobacteria bacterium]